MGEEVLAEAVELTVGLVGGAARTVAEFVSDLWRSLFATGGDRLMEYTDQQFAVADLLALAVLADGEVTELELEALRAHPSLRAAGTTPGELLARARERFPSFEDSKGFERVARQVAARLEPAVRRSVYLAVLELARKGSGVVVQSEGYRAGRAVSPSALLDRFAALLQLSAAERAELEATRAGA